METPDLTKKLKKPFFWQEICLVVLLGGLMLSMLTNAHNHVAFWDTCNVVFFSGSALFFICLIGQFFWKNFYVAFGLSALLGLVFFLFILVLIAALVAMNHAGGTTVATWFGLFLAFGFLLTSISMSCKY